MRLAARGGIVTTGRSGRQGQYCRRMKWSNARHAGARHGQALEALPAEFLPQGEVERLALEAQQLERTRGFSHFDAVTGDDAHAVAAIDGEEHRLPGAGDR